MDSAPPLLIRIDGQQTCDEQAIGGKADKLSQLARAGFHVPGGFCLTTRAYEAFLHDADLTMVIRMELGRKSMDEMRWEEIWDAALRIRAAFLAQPLPSLLREAIAEGLKYLDSARTMAVRSSAVGEDSAGRSFAGLHESIVGVRGQQAIEDAVRVVWSSLWSDAALLYRKELGLDPARSRMAVIVQEMIDGDRSGVAFARDPRGTGREQAIIESVPGPCSGLVDGLVDPDRWELDRTTRRVITWIPGQRDGADGGTPLLEPDDLDRILETLLSVERLFSWPPDMEWTGRSEAFTVLQARPITTTAPENDEQRAWYLTLRPGDEQLRQLRKRVAEQLIPELEAEGGKLAAEQLERLDDPQLADAIEQRSVAVARWKKIYWDQFIPFAHGVRRLATYYNDAVRPEDPYEFVGLLRNQPLIATQRNHSIEQLARQLAADDLLRSAVEQLLQKMSETFDWLTFHDELTPIADGAAAFLSAFEDLTDRFLDIAYDHERLHDRPEPLLRNIVELAKRSSESDVEAMSPSDTASACERRLLTAVGPDRRVEARQGS